MHNLLMIAAEAGHEAAGEHAEAMAFGFLSPGMAVALAMLVVFAIMLRAGLPRIIAGMLDGRIAEIRNQLDEAAKLREEAAALKAAYEKKTKAADGEIAELKANAAKQADDIVAKAKDDAKALIARHKQLAQDKIAAAERAVIDELRAKAASAATAAARGLIADKHSEEADRTLVDKTIASI